ncbi:SH3 beta-barrel fold-containing protein [Parabacteroides distasonis]|nr:SH3 beta-barrel fold-containing protein [Parabacteroides distasonis]
MYRISNEPIVLLSRSIKGTGSENYKTVRYFDVEANGFRSFKVENLITTY